MRRSHVRWEEPEKQQCLLLQHLPPLRAIWVSKDDCGPTEMLQHSAIPVSSGAEATRGVWARDTSPPVRFPSGSLHGRGAARSKGGEAFFGESDQTSINTYTDLTVKHPTTHADPSSSRNSLGRSTAHAGLPVSFRIPGHPRKQPQISRWILCSDPVAVTGSDVGHFLANARREGCEPCAEPSCGGGNTTGLKQFGLRESCSVVEREFSTAQALSSISWHCRTMKKD
ncbi:hypothetical protein H920_08823 [Fukomys damarensis]|uniref:Uncharacterized protein n=1 Tax=Fukomys damarensis TaxID=885580 RepID=A0A091DGQ0_FUKDA|nr:hypothetical protein H920_08823 [Fukomys damarensis]